MTRRLVAAIAVAAALAAAGTAAAQTLRIGLQGFVLIVGGLPRLNHPSFVLLTTALSRRYDPASEPEVDALSAVHPPTGGTFHA